jgi:hypothetical protein
MVVTARGEVLLGAVKYPEVARGNGESFMANPHQQQFIIVRHRFNR